MKFQIREETIVLFNGKSNIKLTHISDLHFWFSDKLSNQIINYIQESNPGLVLMTGDYFDTIKGAKIFLHLINKLSKICSIILIKGNHDKLFGRNYLDQIGAMQNCFLLDKEPFFFTSRDGNKCIVYSWDMVDRILDNNAINIVLLHNPEKIKTNKLNRVDLILSGHLHGGQFVFWKSKAGHLYPGSLLYKNCIDRKQIENTTLIVSKGLGDTLPLRFNCPKEIIEIHIK